MLNKHLMVLDSEDAKLRLIERKIKTLNITLDNMKIFVAKFNLEVNNPNQVDIRLDELESMMRSFLSLQDELELLVDKKDEDRVSERLLFQEKWFDVKAALKELGQHIENQSDTSGVSSKSTVFKGANNFPLRLPAIVAPTFDGDLQQWSSFIDSFNAMFHNNSGLAPSSLTGPASDVVKTIPITDNNYNQAYQKLVERYENPGLIIQSHIRALFDTPKLQEASASQLHKLHHHVTTHVRALESLNQPISSWDAWLVTLLCCRLDSVTVSEWQLKQTTKTLPTFKDFESFLSSRVIAYEAGDTACGSNEKMLKGRHPGRGGERRTLLSNVPSSPDQCRVCNRIHKIFACDKFKQLSVHDRKKIVNKYNLCFKCLYPGHSVRSCKSSWNCSKCNRWHNTLLHDNVSSDKTVERVDQVSAEEPKEGDALLQGSTSRTAMYVNVMNSHVVLSTAIVHITSTHRKLICRAVLDCGSQVSFVTEECAKKLCLTIHKSDMHVAGIGQTSTTSMSTTSVNLHSRIGEFNTRVDVFVLPVITSNLPSCQLNTATLRIPNHVKKSLADPQFDQPGPIDLLLGADVFFEVLKGERIEVSEQASAHSTALGWIITGRLQASIVHPRFLFLQTTLSMNHSSTLSLFSSIKGKRYQEQLEAEEQFTTTVQRNSEGRFIVRLPLSKGRQELGNSLNMARTRFLNLERRLLKNQTLAKTTRCLLQISDSVDDETTKRAIKQDFYVDDFISGADSVEEGLQLYANVSAALQGAGMPLRKWCSNSNTLLSQIPHSQSDPTFVLRLNEEETISTLGLSWQPSVDQFRFVINPYIPPINMTKRTLLSDINRVYDPLGFLTPIQQLY
ncbi:Integrase catalytic domain-containing protein [Aphis craccivora]|uniref:Integrase catalytic domain-containing protein n=1 Tax=Aphis craccivora TaxID=307492 RepID=A0A6G0WYM5_APHCR|nr:Integrase catalytic domain-containing protein [Aphis craccivora]